MHGKLNYRSVPTVSFYRNKYSFHGGSFPVSYDWGEGTLSLPLYPSLSLEEQDTVINVLGQAISQLAMRSARPAEA
jgi:UDP-4-amino-4-deoxy-L-arabinose-oxoglutarate aminotransferase